MGICVAQAFQDLELSPEIFANLLRMKFYYLMNLCYVFLITKLGDFFFQIITSCPHFPLCKVPFIFLKLHIINRYTHKILVFVKYMYY